MDYNNDNKSEMPSDTLNGTPKQCPLAGTQIPEEKHPLLTLNGHVPTLVSAGEKKRQNGSKDSIEGGSQRHHEVNDDDNNDDDDDDDDKEVILTPEMEIEILGPEEYTRGGYGFCTGKYIQKLACPQFYIVLFSTVMLSQSMYFYYANGTLSTIEKRFRLPSKTTGFISTGNDILQMLLALHVAHICGNGHRPRWMALGMIFLTFSCLLTTLPHFIYGAGTYSKLTQNLNATDNTSKEKDWASCGDDNSEDAAECEEKSYAIGSEQVVVITLQFIGQLITGLGVTIVQVTGMSYMDESVSKDKVPLYFGISGAMRIFGPVSAYSMAAWALRKWVEVGVKPSITPSHPHWVGAWWIGYLVIGAIGCVPVLGLLMLPRQMPATRARVLERLTAAAKKGNKTFTTYKNQLRPSTKPSMRAMLSGIKRLLKNRFFMAISINMLVFYIGLIGYLVFSSKYIENNFNISAAKANEYIALVGLVSSLVGWLGTGSILTYLKPPIKHIMYMTLAVSLFSSGVYVFMMGLRCEHDDVIGLDQVLLSRDGFAYSKDSVDRQFQDVSTCMDDCGCPTQFSPVCVDGNRTFFSACHAGCTQRYKENNTNRYDSCSCVDHTSLPSNESGTWSSEEKPRMVVADGRCEVECNAFWWYLGIGMISKILQIANRNISHCLFLRSMDEKDKDIALGLLTALASVCFIIGPIVIGAIIDYSCILWEWTCGRQGFCWLYDLDTYAATIHGLPAVGMLVCFATELLMFRWRKDIDFFGDQEKATLGLMDVLGKNEDGEEKRAKNKEDSKEKDETVKMI